MTDTNVNLATLQRIGSKLGSGSTGATGLATPRGAPEAGPCTGAIAAALGAYASGYADLVDGLSHSADEVRNSHASFSDTELHAVRGDAEADWGGPSGRGFQAFMGKFGQGADKMHDGAEKVGRGLDSHADAMNHVKSRMQQAREVAAKAGLSTSDTQIGDPAPAPAAPGKLPPNATAQQRQAHNAATHAQSQHQAQVRAYNEARQTVSQARQSEKQAQNTLLDLLGGGPVKDGLMITSVTSGLARSTIGATKKYRAAASRYATKAEKLAKIGNDTSLSSATRAKALLNKCVANAKSTVAQDAATGTVPRNALDKLPEGTKNVLTKDLGDGAQMLGRVGRFAEPVLKRVPVVGLLATSAGVGYDISQGKPAGEAVASGASSLAAGAAIGACIGGPVGVVVGAGVGAGVGYLVDHHWGDIKHGAGEAVDWVGNTASDVGSTIASWF